jgi:hypothetical protein
MQYCLPRSAAERQEAQRVIVGDQALAAATDQGGLRTIAILNVLQDEDEDKEEDAHQLALYVDTNQPSELSCVTLTLSKDMTSGIWMFSSVNLS